MKRKEKEVHVRPAILHHTHTCKRIAAGGQSRLHDSWSQVVLYESMLHFFHARRHCSFDRAVASAAACTHQVTSTAGTYEPAAA